MSSTDCNSSIASSTTTTSLGSKSAKKRLSGIKKFRSKLLRRKSSSGEHHSHSSEYLRGGSLEGGYNVEFDSPQDLPGMIVEDVNVSMETVADEEKMALNDDMKNLSSLPRVDYVSSQEDVQFASNYSDKSNESDGDYCPYKSKAETNSPSSQSMEDFINNQMDVAPYSPNRKGSPSSSASPNSPSLSKLSPPLYMTQRSDGEQVMQFSSACGPSPAKLNMLDLSLDNSEDEIYEDDADEHDKSEIGDDERELESTTDHDTTKAATIGNTLKSDWIKSLDLVPRLYSLDGPTANNTADKKSDDIEENSSPSRNQFSGWKNVGRKESIDSRTSTDGDDTFDGWKNVGAGQEDTDGSSMKSSSIDLADKSNHSARSISDNLSGDKHPSDGFLDEYPTIVDEGKEDDGKCVRFEESEGVSAELLLSSPNTENRSNMEWNSSSTMPLDTPVLAKQSVNDEKSPPTTVSASDCMARFSSVTGPSPVKLKSPHSRDYFNFDLSMDTSMESSTAAANQSRQKSTNDSNYHNNEDSDDSGDEDNMNIWNGNGMDIAVDEAGDESTFNESCTDTDGAVDESISFKDGGSVSRSDILSPLTVDGAMQQESRCASIRSLRQAKWQNSELPTSRSNLHLEYNVDHSCSTPLERLARDIGNVLRQWNVHNGCDRHVSLDWSERVVDRDDGSEEANEDGSDGTPSELIESSLDTSMIEKAVEGEMSFENNQIMSMDLCMNRFANRSRKISEWMGEDTKKVPSGINVDAVAPETPEKMATQIKTARINLLQKSNIQSASKLRLRANKYKGSLCIRSKKILFETIGFTPVQSHDVSTDDSGPRMAWTRKRYSIPLLLSLWDAPQLPLESDPDNELTCGIPFSLHPNSPHSSYALLGELGFISPCGTRRPFYDQLSEDKTEGSNVVEFGRSMPPLDSGFGRDLSSLFNIGQHITLSLDLETAQYSSRYNQDHKQLQDIQSLFNDVHAYLTDTIEQALEQKALSVQERSRCMNRHRKRTLKSHDFESHKKLSTGQDIVPVGSQSMSIDIEGEDSDEQVTFCDSSDKENRTIDRFVRSSNDEDSSSDDDETLMPVEDELLLNEAQVHSEVMAILSSTFQNALNLAASENGCCIPVFGLWGEYFGSTIDRGNTEAIIFGETGCAASSWIPSGLTSTTKQSTGSFWSGQETRLNKLLLSSPVINGHCQYGSFRSTHRVYSIPQQTLPLHLSTLHGLSSVLLTQCSPRDTTRVIVTSARHCYHMDVGNNKQKNEQIWRMAGFASSNEELTSPVEVYRETCRRQASYLLERASSPWVYESVPMWGPNEGNPLISLSASVSWGVLSLNETSDEELVGLFSPSSKAPSSTALLQLPLKIRSSNFVPTNSELLDMEHSLQNAAFDPLGTGVEPNNSSSHFGPREPIFFAAARFDSDLPCATLSANVRCVFAALLRCGSLGPDALPGHLTRKTILRKLGGSANVSVDSETNEVICTMDISETMLRAGLKYVGPVTTRLVQAMDWAEVGAVSSNADVDRGVADALQRIGAAGLYPAPPEEIFASDNAPYQSKFSSSLNNPSKYKGAPPGRLLSILFAHMARLRTPPSMMSLWLAFVEELRSRWDSNESLPNLGFVPGLDEDFINRQYRNIYDLSAKDCRVLGHRAHLAAFVNSSEPDPDRDQCIINQKLQVFNICIESKMSLEALQNEELDSMKEDGSFSNSDGDEFFDPEEEEVSFQSNSSKFLDNKQIEAMLKVEAATTMNSLTCPNRIGARCPVPDGLPLIETGDQVYAPYLQRNAPMTDEEEEKQNRLFGRSNDSGINDRLSIRDRIEVSQRIQTPKLMSDMSAFKAANPGCIFEDFVSWYGNPQNPLSEEVNGETVRRAHDLRSKLSTKEAKTLALEEASEAIAILMSLRTFWEDSFEESEPCPASEQHPLFDPHSTVEMVLHSFETMHPSLLMGQVLAVNLKNAEFVLETSSKPIIHVPLIKHTLLQVKAAVNDAIEMLTRDSFEGCLHASTQHNTTEYPLVHVSALTLQNCEKACDAIGETELLLSRALSLWHICPDAELVNNLLQCHDGSFVFLKNPKERSIFLNAIKEHQLTDLGIANEHQLPEASMREYVISNGHQSTPCELNARLVSNLKGDHAALLALTKSHID